MARLSPITSELNRLLQDRAYLGAVLREGSDRARPIAQQTIDDVKRLLGFIA